MDGYLNTSNSIHLLSHPQTHITHWIRCKYIVATYIHLFFWAQMESRTIGCTCLIGKSSSEHIQLHPHQENMVWSHSALGRWPDAGSILSLPQSSRFLGFPVIVRESFGYLNIFPEHLKVLQNTSKLHKFMFEISHWEKSFRVWVVICVKNLLWVVI